MPIFDINSAAQFYDEVVLPEWREFLQNNASRRKAVLTAIVAYHMHEWVYDSKFIPEKTTFTGELKLALSLARRVANGSKHDKTENPTYTQPGHSSAFSDAFTRPLVIDAAEGRMSADQMLKTLIEHWEAERAKSVF